MIGIGIDTGGTYTDAVIYDLNSRKVLSTGKTLTTKENLTIGIENAMDQLDQDLLRKAEMIALSTTLATNAALEDTGSRAKALMIGMDPEHMSNLEQVYASYGFHDLEQVLFIDGRPAHHMGEHKEPDWDELRETAKEAFKGCSAAAVTQVFSEIDGGRLENQAKRILREELPEISVTTAHELFDEVDVLKRGAGTLLNARLVPLIADFLKAVKRALAERHLNIPIVIIRSDGSQMSEEMAREYPVETLLSGPAASAMGGSVLAKEEDAVLVDMGGTTTDIALVRGKHPITAPKGISIGRWRTTVQGLYVDTFLLGGDSAVRFESERLYIDGRRVLPISELGRRHPEVAGKLKVLADSRRTHTRMLNEFYVLQRDVSDENAYTEKEQQMIRLLRKGPMMAEEFAEAMGTSIYRLQTERLENEGVIIRSGLTPTDMMILKGDLGGYPTEAAEQSIRFLSYDIKENPEEIPNAVYRLVEKKMYCNIVRVLLEQKYPKELRVLGQESVARLIELSFEQAYDSEEMQAESGLLGNEISSASEWIRSLFRTELPLVGVGAPIHIFLPKVAKLLGTRAVIPENAPVANALGAIASHIVTRVQTHVKAEYEGAELRGFSVYRGDEKLMFDYYEAAEEFAQKMVREQALEKSRRQGATQNPDIKVSVKQVRSDAGKASLFFESIIEAVATDLFEL